MVCEHLVEPLKGWWCPESSYESLQTFQFLVKCNINGRLKAIGVQRWRVMVQCLVKMLPSFSDSWRQKKHYDVIHSKLVLYEQRYEYLKTTTTLLELAIWKATFSSSFDCRLESNKQAVEVKFAANKARCRVTCGADIIIPNVLLFINGC